MSSWKKRSSSLKGITIRESSYLSMHNHNNSFSPITSGNSLTTCNSATWETRSTLVPTLIWHRWTWMSDHNIKVVLLAKNHNGAMNIKLGCFKKRLGVTPIGKVKKSYQVSLRSAIKRLSSWPIAESSFRKILKAANESCLAAYRCLVGASATKLTQTIPVSWSTKV